jgi:hypothetical protein
MKEEKTKGKKEYILKFKKKKFYVRLECVLRMKFIYKLMSQFVTKEIFNISVVLKILFLRMLKFLDLKY